MVYKEKSVVATVEECAVILRMLCPVYLLDNKKCLSTLIVMSDLRFCCFYVTAVSSVLHPHISCTFSRLCCKKKVVERESQQRGLHDLANGCHQHSSLFPKSCELNQFMNGLALPVCRMISHQVSGSIKLFQIYSLAIVPLPPTPPPSSGYANRKWWRHG
jgi:hypothetical protein